MANRRRAVVMSLVLVVLFCSHWFVYWLGQRNEHTRTGQFLTKWEEDAETNVLRLHIEALQIFAKHKDQISAEEVASWCSKTELFANSAERQMVQNRQPGNDPHADKLERMVEEARRLVGIVKQDKRE